MTNRQLLLGGTVLAVGSVLSLLALAQTPSPRPGQPAGGVSPLNIDFVAITPGEFMMGCSSGDNACNDDERPSHKVRITKPFEIGKYEVTQAQFGSVMDFNPSTIKGPTRPAETVSRVEAQEFISRLNARNDGYRYRLPTEAEWEYAARAGSAKAFAAPLDDIAWHAGNSGDETHPVGQKKPNAWGLYDMQGNVREWVSDWYSSTYYRNSPSSDPIGPTMPERPGPPGGRGGRGPGGPGGPGRGPGRGGPGGGFGQNGFGPNGGGPNGPPPDGFQDGRGPGPQGPGRGGFLPPFIEPCPPTGDSNAELKQQIECLQRQIAQLSAFVVNGGPGGGGPRRGGPPDGGGPPQGLGVMRGGGWDNLESFLRVSSRYNYYGTTLKVSDVGFRIVRERT